MITLADIDVRVLGNGVALVTEQGTAIVSCVGLGLGLYEPENDRQRAHIVAARLRNALAVLIKETAKVD